MYGGDRLATRMGQEKKEKILFNPPCNRKKCVYSNANINLFKEVAS